MVLMLMVALAMISLSTLELRNTGTQRHEEQARANARMALMQAISELQRHAGPDQRVTARAAILEDGTQVANRNWLGVWSTTVESGGRDWPVIGKNTTSRSPYSRAGAYEDLRHVQAGLLEDNWKSELRQRWLVSQGDADFTQPLSDRDDAVVEVIGRGTLGSGLSDVNFERERVLVQKVDIGEEGAYAWYVADNSQKASVDPLGETDHVEASLEASPRGNPMLLELADGSDDYSRFTEDALKHRGKFISYDSAALTQSDTEKVKQALQEKYHDLTVYSPGLFTDTQLGGLRKDLTPLLLADKENGKIDFLDLSEEREFSSSYPMIPGTDHGVLGPSFGALRDWALQTYATGNDAETVLPSSAVRMRPTTHWPHAISDGATTDASEWAESAPKIHPIMTDARWHYYFSHQNKRIRTHIIPRVCLWNPYNKELKIPALTVMMPNPFYNLSHGMHFFPEEGHVNELKAKYADDSGHKFSKWLTKSGYVGGNVYKMRANPFPNQRYLAFSLETTTMAAGECHVFSPKVTSGSVQASGINLQLYQPTTIASNVLSSSSPQGTDHFYYDHDSSVTYQIQTSNSSWSKLTDSDFNEIDFSRIFDYQPEVVMSSDGKIESFPFILKSGTSSSLTNLYSSSSYPTLQLINNGGGGAKPNTYFGYIGLNWGPAGQAPGNFGNLQTFAEAPMKDAPATHQIGAKLLWLNESATEGNNSPLRVDRWTNDHMAYNISPVANWNVRAQLTTRSPVSQCAAKWYMLSTGPWMLQFVPLSPQDFTDQPSLNATGTAFIKNPFGAAADFSISPRVVLFDLPSSDYGVLSLSKLRHAMLSPYSWNPSYIIGHSLRDIHSPAESTAHSVATDQYTGSLAPTRWDYLIGGSKDSGLSHGPSAKVIDSQGLLQIGSEAVSRTVAGTSLSSEEEVLAYDIAYEVNQNLWDRYFISGMPLRADTQSFDWNPEADKPLWNQRYQFNFDGGKSLDDAVTELSSGDGANTAFWENAKILKNKAAFNVNSTSVDAWITFLSGVIGIQRPTASGELDGTQVSFARHRNPFAAVDTEDADPDKSGGWSGARQLTDAEVRVLAANIVAEVKRRGPFVSIADFVNRRLTDEEDDLSSMGTLDAAIRTSGLNAEFENNPEYQSTTVNVGTNTDAPDNNLTDFKQNYRFQKDGSYTTVQPTSQAWGMPGYLTQGDILESIAPALSVRGDTFTIRAYGESSERGEVRARAWIEATVERTPHYIDSSSSGNVPTDAAMLIDYGTGEYTEGGLTEINRKFGRKFVVKSLRWLNPDEI